MKASPSHDQRTRNRLLEAATRQFAERGFKYVTVRAICREAGANVAAVNYHFGDKMGLYRGVFEESAAAVKEVTRAAIEAGRGQPAADQLGAYVRRHCEAIFSRDGSNAASLQLLFHREMMNPTPAIASIVDRAMRPRFEYLLGVVADLVGRPKADATVVLAAAGIHLQVVTMRPHLVAHLLGGRLGAMFTPERVAAHITASSLAGLRALRRASVTGHAASRSPGARRPAAARRR